ncbi:tetratricopeptide repeat protein [Marinilabilia rubra]|uniref:Uncharacterized protein n=1 Tax=Marinilabilia rubra TaxID=2162893 RepID=A0A2U2B3E3_9BACT|nr:tetratricopeptide repeat protein [Marinilabilia rubra]PWD97586.1 hypothetical protein DDZ16_20090 [Marinilabilia rubra]
MKSSRSFAAAVGLLFFMLLGGIGTLSQKTYASVNHSEKDSIKCLQQLSVASLALEKEMFKHAVGPWRFLFKNCPDLSVRMYSDGAKLFKHFVESAKDEQSREAYLDTLLMIYDKRIEYFGDHNKYPEGWIYGRKGMALVRYERKNVNALKEAYECFQKCYSRMGVKTEPAVMISWIQASRALVQKGDHSEEQFLRDYVTVYDHITADGFKNSYNERVYERILLAVKKIFNRTEKCNCETFAKLLETKSDVNELDSNDINVFMEVMEMAECSDSELYTQLVERKYEIKPSAEAAGGLARMFIKHGDFDRAANYYSEALEKTVNDSLKAVFYYELAVLKDGHFKEEVEARQYAKRASALLPGWGKPHLLLGSIYARASVRIEGNELEKSAVYWAAVDQFMMAMKKDAKCSEEARKQIDVYSQYFPDKQTCFFHGLDEGQEFVVGDWINEPTTVRFR